MALEDFKRIVESLRTPVAVADPRGVLTFANNAFAQMVGKAARELSGVPLASLFVAGERKKLQQGLERIAEGKSASGILEAQVDSEEPHWVQVTFAPPLDARERPVDVVVSLQDIDSQRDTETTLNLFAARLFAIADASSIAVMIENAGGEIDLVTEAFRRSIGTGGSEVSLTPNSCCDLMARSDL